MVVICHTKDHTSAVFCEKSKKLRFHSPRVSRDVNTRDCSTEQLL